MKRLLLAVSIALSAAAPARAGGPARAPLPPLAAQRLDPRLIAAIAPDAPPVPVWVELADKGETGPGDLAARLAAAERALTPEARRRRERARVTPLVDYLDLPIHEPYVAALRAAGFVPYGASRWFNRVAVHTSGGALVALAQLPFVRRLEPVEVGSVTRDPAAPVPAGVSAGRPGAPGAAIAGSPASYGQTYTQLLRLDVPAVHDSGYIGTGIDIAVFDEGFNYYRKHTALRNLPIAPGHVRDFVDGDLSVQDTVTNPGIFEHGTWTLSTLGGDAPGIYLGPAYGASYTLARTENSASETPIEMTNWAMAVEWADSLGCDEISSSLGYNIFDPPYPAITYDQLDGHTTVITRAAEIAAAKGMLVVNSAGNDGSNASVGYKISAPADADTLITAAAVDSFGTRPSFSSKGPTYDGRIKPDLAAQGVSVLFASASGDPNAYVRGSGTSFSCPLIAGLAACLLQARPAWTPALVMRALRETASHATAPDTLTGWGIPDGLAALRWIPDTAGAPPPGAPAVAFALTGPNPLRFGGSGARVRFALARGGAASLRALDASGRVIRTLWAGTLAAGEPRQVVWNGDDAAGRPLAPGLYFLDFQGGGERRSVKIALLR